MSGGSTWARQSPEPLAQPPVSSVSVPDTSKIKKTDGAFEDTMFLIQLMKDQREKEIKETKDKRIREMALAQKQKKQEAELKARGTVWLK